MSLKIKLDENLPGSMVELLIRYEHQAVTVKDQGWGGMQDAFLWPKIRAEGRFLITADKGFGNIRKYPPGTHPGILVLRLEKPGVRGFYRLLAQVLTSTRLESLEGCITVATLQGLRCQRPPPSGLQKPISKG